MRPLTKDFFLKPSAFNRRFRFERWKSPIQQAQSRMAKQIIYIFYGKKTQRKDRVESCFQYSWNVIDMERFAILFSKYCGEDCTARIDRSRQSWWRQSCRSYDAAAVPLSSDRRLRRNWRSDILYKRWRLWLDLDFDLYIGVNSAGLHVDSDLKLSEMIDWSWDSRSIPVLSCGVWDETDYRMTFGTGVGKAAGRSCHDDQRSCFSSGTVSSVERRVGTWTRWVVQHPTDDGGRLFYVTEDGVVSAAAAAMPTRRQRPTFIVSVLGGGTFTRCPRPRASGAARKHSGGQLRCRRVVTWRVITWPVITWAAVIAWCVSGTFTRPRPRPRKHLDQLRRRRRRACCDQTKSNVSLVQQLSDHSCTINNKIKRWSLL